MTFSEQSIGALYELYRKTMEGNGTLLSQQEFENFWQELDEDDRSYWLARFHAGSTDLTKELFERPNKLDDEVLEKVQSHLRSGG